MEQLQPDPRLELRGAAGLLWYRTRIAAAAGLSLIALVCLSAVVDRIQGIPFLPFILEVVGILYSGYFVYRYLLFKPDRQELMSKVDELKGRIF